MVFKKIVYVNYCLLNNYAIFVKNNHIMKSTLTTLLFLLCTVYLSAQTSRLFYQLEGGSNRGYNSVILEKDGSPYFFSIRENDGVFMNLTYGPLDEETLSPLSYNYVTLPVERDSFKFLNGGQLSGNQLELMLQKGGNGLTKIEFIEIDLSSNSVINHYSSANSLDYSRGFFRARQVGDKLVSYAYYPSISRIIRFEKGLSENFSVDTLSGVFSNSQSISNKISELEVINGVEYAVVTTALNAITFVKNNGGTFQTTSFPVENQSPRGWDFLQYNGNSLLFLGVKNAIEVDLDFNLIRQKDETYFGNSNLNVEILKKDELLYVFKNESGLQSNYTIVDGLLNIVEVKSFDRGILVNDVISNGNTIWIYGTTIDFDGEYMLPNSDVGSMFISSELPNFSFDEHHRSLKFNDYDINIGNYGRQFLQRGGDNSASITVDGKSLAFLVSDNILGKNTNDELAGIWSRFYSSRNLLSGPIFTSVDDVNLRKDKYNRSYFVTSEMISEHVSNINSSNPNYVMPNGIRFWPGNGNTANGEAQKIVDFVDLNNNGIYEPHLAEFPKIFGDKCLLTVCHQYSGDSLDNNIEVHRYLFTINCDTNELLTNVFFNNTRFINRGSDISEVFVGSYIDYSLGFDNDDFIGTNVELGLTYVYNGDDFDETNGTNIGFQDTIPAFGQLILSGAKLKNDGEDNSIGVNIGESINGLGFDDGIVDNEYFTLETSRYFTNFSYYPYNDAVNGAQMYLNLQGLLADGSPIQYNGETTRYEMFGQSDPNFYATRGAAHPNNFAESTIGNAPGDRRMISGSGAGYLEAGDTLNYLTAYVMSYGDNATVNSTVSQLFVDAQKVKIFFENNDLGCGKSFDLSNESLNVKKVEQLDFTVYPNPFGNELFIRHDFQGDVQLVIRNLNGQEVYRQVAISNQEFINVDLNAGVYFMELNTPKGNVLKKLIRK